MFHWDSNKNCPFCGGEPEITQAIENDPTSLVATCPDDDCVGSTIRCSIDLWNTRATPDIPEKVDVEAITDIAWDVFFNSKKPAPYNQMKDVISHLAAAGYLREPLERIDGLEDE